MFNILNIDINEILKGLRKPIWQIPINSLKLKRKYVKKIAKEVAK
jgi:hypothetical protein